MDVVSMHQAKSMLSQLVHRAEKGEIIYIGAYGKAQAKIVPATYQGAPQKRIGVLEGKLTISEDLDAQLSVTAFAGFDK